MQISTRQPHILADSIAYLPGESSRFKDDDIVAFPGECRSRIAATRAASDDKDLSMLGTCINNCKRIYTMRRTEGGGVDMV